MEAVDNLSIMAELDIPSSPMEIDRDLIPTTAGELNAQMFLDPARHDENRKRARETFRVIHEYLEHLYEKDKGHLKDPEVERGIQALMILAGEAAQKMDIYSKGASGEEHVSRFEEFQDLKQFYKQKILKRFRGDVEGEEGIDQEGESDERETLKIQKQGLKDLEMVRHDNDYELFYIRKENGHPYFTSALLRHLRLIGEFDEVALGLEDENPFLKVRAIEDRNAQHAAQEILRRVVIDLDEFYREALRHKENEFVVELNKAVMALMLAANARNLMSGESPKICLSYFKDFLAFTRAALRTKSYEEAATNQDASSFLHSAVELVHGVISALFLHKERRKEMVDWIHHLIARSEYKEVGAGSPWSELSHIDGHLRTYLKRYPNGPLMKTLDTFREDEARWGFDPFEQEDVPSELYAFVAEDLHISVLRLPAPIHQEVIHEAEVVEEMRAFLRSLQAGAQGQLHLLFNLQDRTSWKEHARCIALEGLQNTPEFSKNLTVITFNKSSDFYLQKGDYQNLNEAELFLSTFYQQIESREACGFHFPALPEAGEINAFTKEALEMIHEQFFSGRKTLLRKERLDFIEIFTQLFFMKMILLVKPDSISFTCKDAIDLGEAQAATFFAFLQRMGSSEAISAEEKDFLLWLLYAPALTLRERLIDPFRFARLVSTMNHIDGELSVRRKAILDATDKLLKGHVKPEIRIAA